MNYDQLTEKIRRRLIWVADSVVDNNPLLLLRLASVRLEDALPLHARLNGLFPIRPVYYEQVYNTLRDNNMLALILNEEN